MSKVLLYVIDMNEQLKSKQEEDSKDGLEISHFDHIRSICIKLGLEAVLVVVIFGVGVGLIKGFNKIKPFFTTTDEKSVSIATLPQATMPEIPKTKTPEKPKADGPEYIPPCYTDEEYNKFIESDVANLPPKDDTEIVLKLNSKSGQLENIPVGKPGYAKYVVKSIVRVVTDNGSTRTLGSGFVAEANNFVAEANNHEKVVVSVAHAVTGDINKIHVETIDGESLKVTGGCRIYGSFDNSQYKNIPLGDSPDVFEPFDVSVLKVDNPDALPAPLTLSTTQPEKGEALYSMNNQVKTNGDHTNVNEVSGFGMLFGRNIIGYNEMIDGLTTYKHNKFSDHTEAGGSGGPTFKSDGKVVGVTIGSEQSGLYLDKEALKDSYNMDISQSALEQIKPVLSTYTDIITIQRAITSPVLNNQSN